MSKWGDSCSAMSAKYRAEAKRLGKKEVETKSEALEETKSALKDIVGGAKEGMSQFIQLNEEGGII